ncbi:MAG: MoaD/ThiS family protein, partial [Actinomycetota bacterium]|nr:MoaD/ThiS family protein [Actinomycetota bacterium]
MAVLRLFAAAREAAGLTSAEIPGATVAEVVDEARRRYGDRFSAVVAASKVWLNGEPARPDMPVTATDVVAILPPVSGGSAPAPRPVVRGNLALVPDLPPEEEPAPVPAPEAERLPLAVVH